MKQSKTINQLPNSHQGTDLGNAVFQTSSMRHLNLNILFRVVFSSHQLVRTSGNDVSGSSGLTNVFRDSSSKD